MASMEVLLEAERRGILPPDKKVLLEEARKRGLVETSAPLPMPESEKDKLLGLKKNIAKVARPALETTGLLLGGAAGLSGGPVTSILLSGAGYAGFKHAADVLEEKMRIRKQPGLVEEVVETGKDIATGAALKMTGDITGKVLSSGFQFLKHFMTTGRSAITLNEIATKEADDLIEQFTPKQSSKALFDMAEQSGTQIPMNQTLTKINEVSKRLSQRSTPPTALAYIKRLQKTISARGNSMTPSQIQGELDSIGELISKREGTGLGSLKQVFSGMLDDLGKAGNTQGAAELLAARRLYLVEKTADEMAEVFGQSTKLLRGQGGVIQFNANQAINKLKASDFFTKAYAPAEQQMILATLKKLNSIPVLQPGAGIHAGSFNRITDLILGGLGYGVAGPAGTTLALARPAAENIYYITQAMKFPQGRQLISDLLTKDAGNLTKQSIAAIYTYVNSRIEQQSMEEEGMLK